MKAATAEIDHSYNVKKSISALKEMKKQFFS